MEGDSCRRQKTTILLADDHALIRDGIKKILSMDENMEVVGEASDGRETVSMAERLSPDVILMDINMPEMNGIEATRIIKEKQPEIQIIAVTIHDDEEYLHELLNWGISGYLLKDVSADELINSIGRVSDGETVFHPDIANRLLGEFRRITGQEGASELTEREVEILQHLAEGESNREIAENLFISEKTVKNHLTNIFRKIDVGDRTQAALYAVKNKITKDF